MGISADQYFGTSANGKGMLLMCAQKGHVEFTRSACEWLVDNYQKDLVAGALQQGASEKAAKAAAENGAQGLRALAEGISDRNAVSVVASVVDGVFQRHYNGGKPVYDKAMAWFADELRKRAKD